jgi:hypothetical protein
MRINASSQIYVVRKFFRYAHYSDNGELLDASGSNLGGAE